MKQKPNDVWYAVTRFFNLRQSQVFCGVNRESKEVAGETINNQVRELLALPVHVLCNRCCADKDLALFVLMTPQLFVRLERSSRPEQHMMHVDSPVVAEVNYAMGVLRAHREAYLFAERHPELLATFSQAERNQLQNLHNCTPMVVDEVGFSPTGGGLF